MQKNKEVTKMRMRNPKNMESILKSCDYFLDDNLFNNNNDINMFIRQRLYI